MDRIAASLGNTTQVNLRRENDIRAALEAQKKRMLDFTHQHDQAAGLQNDVTTAQRNLDAVTQRLAQSSLESQTDQTNIALLTPAVEPLFRSSPKLSVNLLVSVFLGLIASIGTVLVIESLNRQVRDASELAAMLGVPLLGKIPRIKPDGRVDRPATGAGRLEMPAI